MSTPPKYQPVPVAAAASIAQQWSKSAVVILAADPVHGCIHHTTYGVTPEDKSAAAEISERINTLLTGGQKLATFEDFRTTPPATAWPAHPLRKGR